MKNNIHTSKHMITDGFFPALGTPVDNEGILLEKSFGKEIEMMVDAAAAGVLCLVH